MSILKHLVALYCFIAAPISAQNDEPMVASPVPLTRGYAGKYHLQLKVQLKTE